MCRSYFDVRILFVNSNIICLTVCSNRSGGELISGSHKKKHWYPTSRWECTDMNIKYNRYNINENTAHVTNISNSSSTAHTNSRSRCIRYPSRQPDTSDRKWACELWHNTTEWSVSIVCAQVELLHRITPTNVRTICYGRMNTFITTSGQFRWHFYVTLYLPLGMNYSLLLHIYSCMEIYAFCIRVSCA